MPHRLSHAASALADIGHLFESVENPEKQIERALALLERLVECARCALLDVHGETGATLVVFPAAPPDERAALMGRVAALHRLISDHPLDQPEPVAPSDAAPGLVRLALPLVALDEVIGILMVERTGPEYERVHLELLSVVAAQLAAYLANVRLHAGARRDTQTMHRAVDLLQYIGDGFLEIDKGWLCITANRAACELLGLDASSLVGIDVRSIAGLDGSSSFVPACERAQRENRPVHVDSERYGSQDKWYELEVYPTQLGVAVFLRDVTVRKVAEEFRELLSGIIGHDLRTPLTAITMTAQTLTRRGGLDEKTTEAVSRIARSSARMTEMVGQLLELTRIRLGEGLVLDRKEVELGEVCQEAAAEITAAHPTRHIRFEHSGNLRGQWDTARLAQAVTNLVANALQHGDANTPVDVTCASADGASVTIAVHNEGAPIPADVMPTIFQPFRQANRKLGTTSSLGLGLFIVQSIVRAHGGRIEVTSTRESGTTFTVALPRSG